MPTRYIGKDPFFKGKPLYEICKQLRNLGVGRVLYRNSFYERRWPTQTTYVRLTKVVPDMTQSQIRKPKESVAEAWGHAVYRGQELGEIKLTSAHKPDWILVPKDEEAEFCRIQDVAPEEATPTHIACPPLLEMVLKQELTARKQNVPDKIQIPYIKEPDYKEIKRLLL